MKRRSFLTVIGLAPAAAIVGAGRAIAEPPVFAGLTARYIGSRVTLAGGEFVVSAPTGPIIRRLVATEKRLERLLQLASREGSLS